MIATTYLQQKHHCDIITIKLQSSSQAILMSCKIMLMLCERLKKMSLKIDLLTTAGAP